jgi:hypothetical protein
MAGIERAETPAGYEYTGRPCWAMCADGIEERLSCSRWQEHDGSEFEQGYTSKSWR